MTRDKMQKAFDEEMADMRADYVAAGVPEPLVRAAFELGYLAGARAELAESGVRLDRAIEAATA